MAFQVDVSECVLSWFGRFRSLFSENGLTGWWFDPLWKIWVRQLGWWHSQYVGKYKMFQTTNQVWLFDQILRLPSAAPVVACTPGHCRSSWSGNSKSATGAPGSWSYSCYQQNKWMSLSLVMSLTPNKSCPKKKQPCCYQQHLPNNKGTFSTSDLDLWKSKQFNITLAAMNSSIQWQSTQGSTFFSRYAHH